MDEAPKRRRGRPTIWDFGKLAIGEELVVPYDVSHKTRKAVTMFKAKTPGWQYESWLERDDKGNKISYHIKRIGSRVPLRELDAAARIQEDYEKALRKTETE